MEMNADNYAEYYQDQLKAAGEYQDYVCEKLHYVGIVLQNMTSQKYQYEKRENLLGLEIKFDNRMQETKRIYIETAEKSNPQNPNYIPSGIYRDDGSWLYGIGNYDIFYIFDKKVLQRIDKHDPSWLYRPHQNLPTSKGFCIPVEQAEKIAALTVNLSQRRE